MARKNKTRKNQRFFARKYFRFSRKAQIAGEILIYILAIVVFSLTLIYGYKAVKYFTQRSTEISFLELENKIKNDISRTSADSYGTVKKTILTIPGSYTKVCLVNSKGRTGRDIDSNYSLISEALGSTNNNMFLYPPGSVGFDIGDISVDSGFCADIQGNKVTLRLESMGDHVKVSEWK
jgi:hypothetical protein